MIKHIIIQFIGIIIVYFGVKLLVLFSANADDYNYVPLGVTLIYIFKFRKKIFMSRIDK